MPDMNREGCAARLHWIEEGDKEILFLDLKNASSAEALDALKGYKQCLLGRAPRSVLVLVDVTGVSYNSSVSARWKAARLDSASLVRASAVYGALGIIGVAIRGFIGALRLLGMRSLDEEFCLFQNRADALEWLVQR